jgi:hypothetical protein
MSEVAESSKDDVVTMMNLISYPYLLKVQSRTEM